MDARSNTILQRKYSAKLVSKSTILIAGILLSSFFSPCWCQSSSDNSDLRSLVLQLQADLNQTRADLQRTQQQVENLSRELATSRVQSSTKRQSSGKVVVPPADSYASPVDAGAEAAARTEASPGSENAEANDQLLRAQVEEQQQTKVESSSKYRVKLSGLILMNAFSNRGAVDHADLANRAFGSSFAGTVGATLRQSLIGLQVIGPQLAGAQSSASVTFDFAGGFPQRPFGETMGIMRLRQATARLDWTNTSVVIGQDTPFVSPLSPTSYATLAEPALSWSGNLWVWTPQVFVDRKFRSSDATYFSLGAGLAAPLTEEPPDSSQTAFTGAGELSRRPAFEAVAAWHSTWLGQSATVGIGGYLGRHKYALGRSADAWAGTMFFDVPLAPFLVWSAEGYRGQALGGLGGGIWQSVFYNGDAENPLTDFRPANAIGGWTQIKYKAHPKLDFNLAVGQDNVLSYSLRWAPQVFGEYSTVFARNRVGFANAVYRPKSNLLFSVEYRKLWTWRYTGQGNRADQVNVAAGVSF